MAKLTEIVVAIEAEGVGRVLSALNQVEGAQARVADSSKNGADAQKKANESAGMSWATLATGVNHAIGVITSVVNAGKTVYNFTKEGAQLEYAAGKFDRLAEAAGTTSDVLLGDLKAATRGMVSDAELMGSAGDFMALGLAKSHDEVVRLTAVAGALGMNMNQLVLTLTNQTTKRFDALGVSVDGFKEKVAALEAVGYSAQDAFTEAFLQQAEGQIAMVGSMADTAAGQFAMMEAAQTNYFNAMKQDLAEAGSWWAQFWAGVYNDKLDVRAYNDLIEQAKQLGIDTMPVQEQVQGYTTGSARGYDYSYLNAADAEGIEQNKAVIEELGEQVRYQAEMNAMRNRGTNANYKYSASEKVVTDAMIVSSKFQAAMTGSSNIGANYEKAASDWGAMRNMAEGYNSALELINTNSERQKALEPFKETGGYIDGVWKSAEQVKEELEALAGSSADAEAAMAQMAANMTLSFMQASMGIDGYTESEIDALTQYMVDAGLISQAAADKMKADYMAAITYANALELDAKVGEILANIKDYEDGMKIVDGKLVNAKTGEILADLSDYLDGLTEADLAELPPKVAEVLADIMPYIIDLLGLPDPDPKVVDITANYIEEEFTPTKYPREIHINVVYDEERFGYQTAIGGPVYPGQNRTWNEPGREGEMLIPEQYGRVLSNHEVAQVMRDALMGGGGGEKNGAGSTVINNYSYVLTMPTTSNPADVRTAFELMEAWNA